MEIRFWRMAILALALGFAPSATADEGDTRLVSGTIEFVSERAVEVGGTRGLFDVGSSVTSDGRVVSWRSVRRGMSASLEIDSAGRVLLLDVPGVME